MGLEKLGVLHSDPRAERKRLWTSHRLLRQTSNPTLNSILPPNKATPIPTRPHLLLFVILSNSSTPSWPSIHIYEPLGAILQTITDEVRFSLRGHLSTSNKWGDNEWDSIKIKDLGLSKDNIQNRKTVAPVLIKFGYPEFINISCAYNSAA